MSKLQSVVRRKKTVSFGRRQRNDGVYKKWTKLGLQTRMIILGIIIGVITIVIVEYKPTSLNPGLSPGGVASESSQNRTDQPQTISSSPTSKPPTSMGTPKTAPKVPAGVLDLTNWLLTLPINTDHSGNPDEIRQPELATFSSKPYFQLNETGDGVLFRAYVNGVTTANSSYPRSELREMTAGGRQQASWSSSSGSHSMTIRQAITHLPVAKPEVVAAQIHDSSDDVIMVRLNGNRLFVEADGKDKGTLNANYSLGSVYTVQITASSGHIKVFYNGEQKVDYEKNGSGYYFKAGCYTQSNTTKGDSPSAYGETIIYSLSVHHS